MIKAEERLAFQCLARFQRLEPNSARSHVLLGDIYRQRERYDDAIAEYQKALIIAPNDPASLLGLASAELINNDMNAAIKVSGAASLEIAPKRSRVEFDDGQKLCSTAMSTLRLSHFLAKSLTVKPPQISCLTCTRCWRAGLTLRRGIFEPLLES